MTDHLTFPALPSVLRRCSPVIVHSIFGDCKGVIVTGDGSPAIGWLVTLQDGARTSRWSNEVPAWPLSLDLSDPTGVDHLRDWLARTVGNGNHRLLPVGSKWDYDRGRRAWRLQTWVGPRRERARMDTLFMGRGPIDPDIYCVPGLTAKLLPAEALRLCALAVAREKGLLP